MNVNRPSGHELTRRFHLFEFCESSFCPEFIRESIVDLLGESLQEGGIFAPVAPIFADFCDKNKVTSILDLGSGSGKPASILIEILKDAGMDLPFFYLSDLFPNKIALNAIKQRYPDCVDVIRHPVDVTDIPSDIDHQARTLITLFHHFSPETALRILQDCVKKRKAVFIMEPFSRHYKNTMPVFINGILPGLTYPLRTGKSALMKGALIYLFPLIPLCAIWDGVISSLRMYTEKDLMKMVSPFKGYEWNYHRIPITFGGTITVFTGSPV